MLLWIGFAVLAVMVVGALALPLREGGRVALDAREADAAIFRDQLREIEADRNRGLLSDEDAASSRAEIARRLFQIDAAASGSRRPSAAEAGTPKGPRASAFLSAILLAIPLVSIAVYLSIGSPLLPGQPLASREALPAANASIAELVGKVEARLREQPQDGKGWDVIAPVYMRLGRAGDAANAYAQSIRLNGETVARLLGFGDASLIAANGIVNDEVKRTAERILALEPDRIQARIWLTLGKEQDGDLSGAASDYGRMISEAPADAPWREAVADRLADVEARLSGKPRPSARAAAGTDGPARAPADAAAGSGVPAGAEAVMKMSPGERAQFIESMVGKLAARLETDGKDVEGWQKLVRAYQAMGRTEDARKALTTARANLAGDNAALQTLDTLAKDLGLGS